MAGEDTVDWIRSETGGFGADYTFEATGLVSVMRQAVESAREAWGLATMCGVAGKGEVLEVVPRFLITGRRVTGSSFGGVKGRTQVPLLVDRWLAGRDRRRVAALPPDHPGRGQPRLRADARPGRHPQRDHVRLTGRAPSESSSSAAGRSERGRPGSLRRQAAPATTASRASLPGARATVQPTASRKNDASRTTALRRGVTRWVCICRDSSLGRIGQLEPTVAASPCSFTTSVAVDPEPDVRPRGGVASLARSGPVSGFSRPSRFAPRDGATAALPASLP